MSTLEVRDLTVEFAQRGGAALRAVDGLSMTLREGQTVALVGESGSGKSTVVRALSWLLRPAAGQILIDDERVGRRGSALRAYRRRVQPIFQDPYASLNPRWRVRDIVAEPLRAFRILSNEAAVRERVGALLVQVGLSAADAPFRMV